MLGEQVGHLLEIERIASEQEYQLLEEVKMTKMVDVLWPGFGVKAPCYFRRQSG